MLTITALRQLSFEKKRLVVQFLYDIGYARRGPSFFYRSGDTEDDKNLKGVILNNIDFGNDLQFWKLLLRQTYLINASFANSYLEGSDFTDSVLTGVNFSQTNLIGVRFFNTQLQQTDFQGASLENAQFIRSNLTQSNITDEQLSQALTIYNTVLPNGTYARNKSYVINGDANEGMNGWNIISGDIRVKDYYFTGYNQSTMVQRINTTRIDFFGSLEAFRYCLSFLVHGKENLAVEITFTDNNQKKTIEKFSPSECRSSVKCFIDWFSSF